MFSAALDLFLLCKLPFAQFTFSRTLSALAITILSCLFMFTPSMQKHMTDPKMGAQVVVVLLIVSGWIDFIVQLVITKWWMKRGHRWDGQGDLFNLILASELLASCLSRPLSIMIEQQSEAYSPLLFFVVSLFFYSVVVKANALSGAIPKATLSYSFAGVVIAGGLARVIAVISEFLLLLLREAVNTN